MAQTIKLRRSSTAGAVPTTAQLALGEVAINTADGKLFIKKDDGTESIVEIGAGAAVASSPVKFDDISGSFNGSDTTFNITVSSSAYTPGDVLTTIVSLNGVTQEPNTSYTISGSQISFTDPPASSDDFYGIDLSTIISQYFGAGTEASPSITFVGDTDTGIYKPAANTLGFSTNGDEKLRIDSSGNIGINTIAPDVELHIKEDAPKLRLETSSSLSTTNGTEEIARIEWEGTNSTNSTVAASIRARQAGTWSNIQQWNAPTALEFYTQDNSGSEITTPRLTIDDAGKVGIGTTAPVEKLVVSNGGQNGIEFHPNYNSNNGLITVYDRNANAYKQLTFSADSHVFSEGGAERARFDDSGRLLVGGTTNVTHFVPPFSTLSPTVQVSGTSTSGASLSVTNYNSGGFPATIFLGSSKGGSVGTQGIVADDGDLGRICFTGSDGTNLLSAASILAEVDGTPGSNDMPGRLVFQTTPDGSTTLTEGMRITSAGCVGIAATDPGNSLEGAGLQVRRYIDRNQSYFAPDGHYAGSFGAVNNTVDKVWLSLDAQYLQESAVSAGIFLQSFFANAGGSDCGVTIKNTRSDNALIFSKVTTAASTFNPAVETERMRIAGSGNVGIGTSSPTTKLDVVGSAFARQSDNSKGAQLSDDGSIEVWRSDSAAYIDFKTSLAEDQDCRIQQASNGLAFSTGGNGASTEAMRIDSSGNVGIGTTSPGEKLEVSGNIKVSNNSGSFRIIGCADSSNTTLVLQGGASSGPGGNIELLSDGQIINDGLTHRWRNTNGSSEYMRIVSSGNVGIGTTSPGARLEVIGASSAGYAAQFANSTETNRAKIYVDANGAAFVSENFNNGFEIASNTARIYANGSERMRVDSSGDLGIGTTSPDERLHVTVAGATGSGSTAVAKFTKTVSGAERGLEILGADELASGVGIKVSGTNSPFLIQNQSGTELFRVASAGQIGIIGANYGTSGQVLTSNGSSSAPSWQDAGGGSGFDSGTAMLFQQTAAPTGWTKSTTHNNKALRVVSGTAGSGGSSNFDSVFGSSISTNAHTLSTSEIPSHNHTLDVADGGNTGSYGFHSWDLKIFTQGSQSNSAYVTLNGGGSATFFKPNIVTASTNSTGSGGSHSHTMSMNIAYVDTIIATKD